MSHITSSQGKPHGRRTTDKEIMQTQRSFLADISPHSPLSGTGMKQLWILDALEICSLKILPNS